MKKYRLWKALRIAVLVLAACVFMGFAVMLLWNWLMPAIFGLKAITFWQALGLLVLSKILLGGFHRHGSNGRRAWKRKMHERWEQMTPEERERFRAGIRGRFGCRPARNADTEFGQRTV